MLAALRGYWTQFKSVWGILSTGISRSRLGHSLWTSTSSRLGSWFANTCSVCTVLHTAPTWRRPRLPTCKLPYMSLWYIIYLVYHQTSLYTNIYHHIPSHTFIYHHLLSFTNICHHIQPCSRSSRSSRSSRNRGRGSTGRGSKSWCGKVTNNWRWFTKMAEF
jgi:hypothetical protein